MQIWFGFFSEQDQEPVYEFAVLFFDVTEKDSIGKAFYRLVFDVKSHYENWENENSCTRSLGESVHTVFLDLGNSRQRC